jgi:hypothetical protein
MVSRIGRARLLGALVGVVVALGAFVAVHALTGDGQADASSQAAAPVPPQWQRPAVPAAGLVDRSGVKITQVALTGEGGLVDLRFQVVDAARAASLHEAAHPPALVDEATGAVVNQVLMNHAHKGAFTPGVTYYLVFENPGNWLRHGSRVTVLLGDAQVEHVAVS